MIEPPADKEPKEKDDEKKLAAPELAQVGAGVAVLGTVLAALVFTSVLERAARNETEFMMAAFFAAVIAGTLWFLAGVTTKRPNRLRASGAGILAIGLGAAIIAVLVTYRETESPSIAAELEEGQRLAATVTAAGLTSNDQVGVRVEAFQRNPPGAESEWQQFTLYEAALGPNTAGVVNHAVKLPIAYGTFELLRIRATTQAEYEFCPLDRVDPADPRRRRLDTGCLIMTLPRFAVAPRVEAVWERDGTARILAGRVQADNAPHRVVFHVVMRGRRRLGGGLAAPDINGKIDASIRIPVPASARAICLVARWHRQNRNYRSTLTPLCPPRINADTGWVMLSQPRLAKP